MRNQLACLGISLALAVVAACKRTPPAADTATLAAPRDAPPPSIGGALSEAEFKALHQLRTDEPPPRKGQMIELAGGKAYLSLPEGATGPFPGIVVIQEWWGLNENVKHWADRLAGLGWAAIAVDLYNGVVATTPDEAMAAVKKVDNDAAAKTISAALDFLATDPRIKAPTLATIGWCFGGGWSLRTALSHPELDGAILYYGSPETDPAKLATIKAEVLGIFGNRDTHITPAVVDELEAGLTKAGVRHAIYRYDADHAFANPSAKIYDETAASDAWEKVKTFLARIASR